MQLNTNSVKITLFFENLRDQRNMSLEELTYDIVSIRQYRRFLKGECQMSQNIFNALAVRLGFKPEHMMLYLHHDNIQENELVKKFYNAVANKNFSLASKINEQITSIDNLEEENILLHKYAIYFQSYYKKEINNEKIFELIYSLIDFDVLIKQKVFTSTEFIILTSLLHFPHFDKKDVVMQLLANFIEKQDFIIGYSNERMYLLSLYHLSYYTFDIGEYEKTIYYANLGIKFCREKKLTYLIEDYHYYGALAYQKLNDLDNLKETLFRLFCVLSAENNEYKINKYNKLVKEHLNIDLGAFIKELLK